MFQILGGAEDAKTITFPNTVRKNSVYAFLDTSVQSVILNEELETIRSRVFYTSKIKRIIIPKSVTKIESSAFEDCKNLK